MIGKAIDYVNNVLIRGLKIKKEILNYYKDKELDDETVEILSNIKKKFFLSAVPYNFIKKYKLSDINVELDEDSKLPYVIHENKKLFFKSNKFKIMSKRYYKTLLMEGDQNSPHKYLNEKFQLDNNTILFDLGAAEGIFALENIEKCKKVYLFECDDEWINSLKKTFEPYKDKVIIVKKYVSDKNNENEITLDSYIDELKSNDKVFIKMDIEGAEMKALKGAFNLIEKIKNLKMAVCTYHNQSDQSKIEKKYSNKFDISYTNGFMLYYYDDNFVAPYFRRGVARIKKKK